MTKTFVDNYSPLDEPLEKVVEPFFDEPVEKIVGHDDVSKDVDFFYEFKDKTLQAEYVDFRMKRLSYFSIITVALCVTCFILPSHIIVLIKELLSGLDSYRFPQRVFLSCINVTTSLLLSYSSFMILWMKARYRNKNSYVINNEFQPPTSIESAKSFRFYFILFHIALVAFFNFTFLRRSLSYNCMISDSFVIELFGGTKCNEENGGGNNQLVVGLSLDATILIVNPFLTFVSMSSISCRFIWLNLLCSVATVVCVSCYLNIFSGVFQQLIFLLIFTFTGVVDLQHSRILEFFHFRQTLGLHETVNEVKAASEAIFKEEMRLLIGNVAHDIKSPLTSFVTGLDYLEQILSELKPSSTTTAAATTTEGAERNNKILHSRLDDMENCVESLRSTYYFALAIINRSTDYYRFTVGMNLIPMKDLVDVQKVVLDSIRYVEGIAISSKTKVKLIWDATVVDEQQPLLHFVNNHDNNTTNNNNNNNDFAGIEMTQIDEEEPNDLNVKDGATISPQRHHNTSASSSSNIYMNTDEDWLRENLLCLISNGLKFSNDGDVLVSITKFKEIVDVIHQKRVTYLRFSVIDHGLCLSDEALKKMFLFQMKQQHRSGGGIGLGLLALAKRVDALEGKYGANRRLDGLSGTEVWFALPYHESKSMKKVATYLNLLTAKQSGSVGAAVSGSGSGGSGNSISNNNDNFDSFFSSLPTTPAATNATTTAISSSFVIDHQHSRRSVTPNNNFALSSTASIVQSPPPLLLSSLEETAGGDNNPLHCLIVDDSSAILKMLSMMFRKLGFVISTATHGKGAVESVQNRFLSSSSTSKTKLLFDLILMDIQMPVMNGLDAMKAIRQFEQAQTIKSVIIIAMSANSEFLTYQDAINAGADAFLNKPFTMELFQRTLLKIQKKKGLLYFPPPATTITTS